VVLCDEPVNGLDPEGIRWIRTMLRDLAAEGRTVFVSSHLMSEMALTADHVIVVGRGRLIADASVADIVAQSASGHVLVRTPDPDRLDGLIRAAGGSLSARDDGAIEVSGVDCARIGELAARHAITLHELSPHHASLEAAFLELTHDSVDFRVEEQAS
jgi:ABC-2 type transport system ATP-binding protein